MTDGGTKDDKDADFEFDSQKMIKFRLGRVIGKRWKVDEKLDEGGFGQVYKVSDQKNGNRPAALKVESVAMEGGSAIKLEINVLEQCHKKGPLPHLPILYHARKHQKYVYMVMELLGTNLRHFKGGYQNEVMPDRDWARVGVQCLHGIKVMHDQGFVHRDLKPSNFVFGHSNDISKMRVIHVLDFGLSRGYAIRSHGVWIARKARRKIDFRGTFRYASPNMHRFEDLGRRDDMYSLMYMLIEFACSLPWQYDKDKQLIETKKFFYEENPKQLSSVLPAELGPVLPSLRHLTYYSRPNYSQFYDGLLAIMKRNKVTLNDRYTWEEETSYKEWIKQGARRCMCDEQAAFMKSDPIKINGPPSGNVDEGGATREDVMKSIKGDKVAPQSVHHTAKTQTITTTDTIALSKKPLLKK